LLIQTDAPSSNVNIERSVLAFKSQFVLDNSVGHLFELDSASVFIVNESVPLKESDWWLNSDLAAVTLATQVEVHDWDREELSVATDIGWHGDLA